ncbi:putative reverse transcriptase domain-containing protein [Tanacetum coccineum]
MEERIFERSEENQCQVFIRHKGHPKPHQQPQGYADASLQGSVKIELPAGIYAVKNSVSENMQPFIVLETLSHVTPPIPKSSSFFADYGMDNGEFLYRVTEDSLIERLNTNMHEACLQIDKDCRVFTIHGSDDTIVRAKEALEFVEIIPNHKLHVVKGANYGFSKHQDELISLNNVHDTFHVSNLKKCLANPTLQVPLEEIHVDDMLNFVEESVESLERELKKLKRSRIAIVKVRWNSKRRPGFTWEHEDKMKLKYPHMFSANSRVRASLQLACMISNCQLGLLLEVIRMSSRVGYALADSKISLHGP